MFTCSLKESDAGPTNNWVYEPDMKVQLKELFKNSMKGRTLYVVPFSMAPMGSSFAKVGILFTDSPWNVILKKIYNKYRARSS
jgi:phosphoenolpyruvate carboxykinase (GTP)